MLHHKIALRDERGAIVKWYGSSIDIEDRRRTEDALRASEERFRTLVDHAADAFLLADESGIVVDVNRQACESLGYRRDELIGMRLCEIDLDADLSAEWKRARRDVRDGRPAVSVSVRDHGVGLENTELDRLFEAFYSTKPHGMGMGLAMTRSIIDAHGGDLWAEANRGPGATFSFRLPAAPERPGS